jgi:hypothetical protein
MILLFSNIRILNHNRMLHGLVPYFYFRVGHSVNVALGMCLCNVYAFICEAGDIYLGDHSLRLSAFSSSSFGCGHVRDSP